MGFVYNKKIRQLWSAQNPLNYLTVNTGEIVPRRTLSFVYNTARKENKGDS